MRVQNLLRELNLLRCKRRWAMISETHFLQITSVWPPPSSCSIVFDHKSVMTVTRLQNPAQIKISIIGLDPPIVNHKKVLNVNLWTSTRRRVCCEFVCV